MKKLIFIAFLLTVMLAGCKSKKTTTASMKTTVSVTTAEESTTTKEEVTTSIEDTTTVSETAAEEIKYTVTLKLYGEEEITMEVTQGNYCTPEEPVRDGYDFLGWYIGDEKFDFSTTVIESDITVEAKWELQFGPLI